MSTYGLKDASNITLFPKGSNKPALYIDYANQTNTQWQSNRVYAKKKGTNAISWDTARTGTLTIQTEMFDLKLLAIMAGDDLHKGSNTVFKRKRFQLTSDRLIQLDSVPVEGSVSVFKLKDDDKREQEMEVPMLVDGDGSSMAAMPENVSVSAKDTSASITWSASKNANSYIVYRDGSIVGYPVSASYEDADLKPETTYKYTVVAVNTLGNSAPSAEVVVKTATQGSEETGKAVTATEDAIKKAKDNAKAANANGLYFKMTEGGNGIQLSDEAVVGATYAVYYVTQQDGVLSYKVNALQFAGNYEIVADSVIRNEAGEDKFAQIHFFNARPQGGITFNQNSEQVTSLSMVFDLLPNEDNDQAEYKYIE